MILGILDLYHKYDGTFIELQELEHMIICALDEEIIKNPDVGDFDHFLRYYDFLIQMIELYKFRYLFNYLLVT